jgi:hypothetical protein
MASSRSNKSGSEGKKKDVKFVKSSPASSKRVPKKAVRSAVSHTVVKPSSKSASKPSSKPTSKASRVRKTSAFKGERTNVSWNDLVTANDKKKSAHSDSDTFLNTLSTARFAAVLLSILTLFTLYVGHVLTSQDLLKDVQTMQRENQTLNLRLNQLLAEEDEMTGPVDIFNRARVLGLSEHAPLGKPIYLD